MDINIIHTIKLESTTALMIIGGAVLLLIIAACVFQPMSTPSVAFAPQEDMSEKAPMGFVQ